MMKQEEKYHCLYEINKKIIFYMKYEKSGKIVAKFAATASKS